MKNFDLATSFILLPHSLVPGHWLAPTRTLLQHVKNTSAMSHENRGPQVMGIASSFLALTTIAIALRCYCRALVAKCFGLDDWLAVAAWVSNPTL